MEFRISPQSIIKLLFLSSVCICVFDIMGFESIVSILYVLMFPFVVGLTVIVLSSTQYSSFELLIVVAILILALITSVVDVLLAKQGVSLFELKKVLIFSMTIAFLFVSNNIRLDDKTKRFIDVTIIVSSAILIALYFLKHDELYDYTNLGIKYLYFNFTNPNFASMYFLVYYMYNLILSWKSKKSILKILCFCFAMFMFFAVVETLSRNTILIAILFGVVFCYVTFKKQLSLLYSRAVSVFVSVWPLLFSFVYMLFINYSDKMKFLSFLDMNKGFDTRTDVWTKVFERLAKSPIFGDFSFAILRQAHNSHLDIWVSYGVATLVLTCLLTFLIVHHRGQVYSDRISYLYMFGFICCCFIGMAEAALFAGCQGLFIMIGIFILLSKSENTV